MFHHLRHLGVHTLVGATLAFGTAGAFAGEKTVTSLAVSPNRSVYGQPVTLTATVKAPGDVVAVEGGTVEFKRGDLSLGIAMVSGGLAIIEVAGALPGAKPVVAVYDGTEAFEDSTSRPAGLIVGLAKTSTALTLLGTPRPGATMIAKASVQALAPSKASPVGSVTFRLGARTIGSARVGLDGTAELPFTVAVAGPYRLLATFKAASADAGFQASTSRPLTFEASYATGPETVIARGANLKLAAGKIGFANSDVLWTVDDKGASQLFGCEVGDAAPDLSACTPVLLETFGVTGVDDLETSIGGLTLPGVNLGAVVATVPNRTSGRSLYVGLFKSSPLALVKKAVFDDLLYSGASVAATIGSEVIVAYVAQDPSLGGSSVYYRRFKAGDLSPVGGPVLVASSDGVIVDTAVGTDMASTTKGFYVGWIDGGIPKVQRYKASGDPVGPTKPISPVVAEDVDNLDISGVVKPMGTVAAWQQAAAKTAAPLDVRMRRYDVAGHGLALTGVATDPKGAQSQPDEDWFRTFGWATVWTTPDASGSGVAAKLFDATGKAIGGEFAVNAGNAGDQDGPEVATTLSLKRPNDFYVFWRSRAPGSSVDTLVGRRFTR